MKTFLLLLISTSSFAQPFLGLGVTNQGANFHLGVLAGSIEITAGYKMPFNSNDVAKIASLQIGKQILLSNNDQDNYSITPSIGYANYRVQDFAAYNNDPSGKTGPSLISEFRPIAGVEVGKDSYMGRVFVSANYCKGMYYGIGIKMFPYRN